MNTGGAARPYCDCPAFRIMHYPFTIIIGDGMRLRRYLAQQDVAQAFSRTRWVEPERIEDEFPGAWRWSDAVCALFSQPHRWRADSLPGNLRSLCREAKMLDRQVIFHVDFESDLRRMSLPFGADYTMRL